MITSPLPIKPSLHNVAVQEGVLTDLSKIKFPTCKTLKENYLAMFLYLRNTGIECHFNYREMNYSQKAELIMAYLETPIDYSIPELTDTWVRILFQSCGASPVNICGIMNDLEAITFMAEKNDYINKLKDFLFSLPLFCIKRLKDNVSFDDVETTADTLNLVNLCHVITHPALNDLYQFVPEGFSPKFYESVFTEENEKLFQLIIPSFYSTVLYGLSQSSPDEFLEFLNGVVTVDEYETIGAETNASEEG